VCGGHSRKARKRKRSWCRLNQGETPPSNRPF
jgi:hypothetical protein